MDNPYYIGLADNPEPPEEESEPEVIAKCERCGDELKDYDESFALVSTDGSVHHFCRYCTQHAQINPWSVITDILDAAGIFYATGWSDDVDEACRGAAERMKVSGGVNG